MEAEIIILILLDFITKDITKNKAGNKGIHVKNNTSKPKSKIIPITVGITAANPNINKFRMLSILF